MSYAQEGSWGSASVAANAAATTISPTFLGGGFELLIVPLIIDVSSGGATGATISHANLSPGGSYIAATANNELIVFCWGIWTGSAQTPSVTVSYTSGNAGPAGGRVQNGVFTGAASNIIASPGPSMNASGGSSPAAVTLSGVATGSLVVALMNNTAGHAFTAGSGYTLIFGSPSTWSGNMMNMEQTTGLSEPGGSPIIQASFSPNANWSMMAVAFPSAAAPPAVPPLLSGRCTYILP